MIIVLGESVLAASLAIQSATEGTGVSGDLLQIIVGGLLIIYSIWWIYFDRPGERLLSTTRTALRVAIDATVGHSELGSVATGAVTAVPVAIFLLSGWALCIRVHDRLSHWVGVPVVALMVLAASLTSAPVLIIGLLLVSLVVIKVVGAVRKEGQLESQVSMAPRNFGT